jgi:hypothetical protein
MTMAERLATLPQDAREDFEERAALMEYDGGLERSEAEERALAWQVARLAADIDRRSAEAVVEQKLW